MGQRTLGGDDLSELRRRYRALVTTELPRAARDRDGWPVDEDHCFVRIVLDDLFDDVWYEHVPGRPAYEHLSPSQLREAVETAERMLDEGRPLVDELNRRSLDRRDAEDTASGRRRGRPLSDERGLRGGPR
ncbi:MULTISPECIES: hypothetical protein [Halorubrum]|uniref:GCN5-related N-acetyltransferase n=1 Tax=Halorubrum hochstenium ATCC 700873 TaxID=1227481 RepID=M0FQA6_9EURY|nr:MULTISPECIES: hypothetical protein [Halorubrum]ELZ61463.1 hypothetical protein C467_01556 [Halorubrum hochstenium ATCC 700873]